MEANIIERIRGGLLEKRRNLAQWLTATPAPKKQIVLGGEDDRALQATLSALDTALQQTENETLGVCQVCHEIVDAEALELDYTRNVCIDHLSSAEREQLETELELSQQVQKALLPQQVPTVPGMDIAVSTRPAQIVSGDYFDFFKFRDGTLAFVIADVAGHGVSASLLMMSVQAVLRTVGPESNSALEVLRRVDHFFSHNIRLTTFVTLFIGRYDPMRQMLEYCNAGHNPPLIVRKQSDGVDPIMWLKPTGAAIGLIESFRGQSQTITLMPGDILLLYTDGVVEAANARGEEFGQARLAALVRQHSNSTARELIHNLRDALREFADGQPLADDTTLIACKIGAAND